MGGPCLRPVTMFRSSLAFLLLALGACTTATSSDPASTDSQNQTAAEEETFLPNWATPAEEAIESSAPYPAARLASAAPNAGYHVPAEYEPVQTVVMTWTGSTSVLAGIGVAAAKAGAQVWMVGGPRSITGIPADHYKAVSLGYDSIWMRDYGPFGYNAQTGEMAIVDTTYRHHAVRTRDDAMSCELADLMGASCAKTPLIIDGGNYMTDGQGNVFVTRRIYDWNANMTEDEVDGHLKAYLGATTIHKLPYAKTSSGQPADGTGHIDMMAKLVAPCKAVVVETPDEPFKTATNTIADYLKNLSCGEGTYEVTRVAGWVNRGTWYTYSNSLTVNKSVIIPFYNDTAKNNAAVAAYKAVLPDYEVVGVMSESTIVQGGSIHCITKEIPVPLPATPAE